MKPTLKPLEEWICDRCGEVIHGAKQGYLEWLKRPGDYENLSHGFRIVHHALFSPLRPEGNCYYDHRQEFGHGDLAANMPLDHCVGPDGLAYLVSWQDRGRRVAGDEFAEVIRRLHIPQYEEARQYFSEARENGFFDGANEYWPYLQEVLRQIIERYGEAGEKD